MSDYRESSDRFYENKSKEKYDPHEAHEEDDDIPAQNTSKDKGPKRYIEQLIAEKLLINESRCPYAYKYICEEIERAQQKLVKGPPRDTRYIDVYNDKPTKVSVKVLFPIKEHPRFNFVGKLLGPKGNTLKQLQEESRCFMNICGRGSVRDREKEEELRQSLDPRFAHLSDELHVEIGTIAAPAEAHTRIAFALKEIRKHLVPDYNNPELEERIPMFQKAHFANFSNEEYDDQMPKRRALLNEERGPPPGGRGGFRPSQRAPIGGKSSVMSILNKARIAIQESYNYEDRPRPGLMKRPDYNDYEEEGNGYPPRRYDDNRGYGKNIHDGDIKKRRFYMD